MKILICVLVSIVLGCLGANQPEERVLSPIVGGNVDDSETSDNRENVGSNTDSGDGNNNVGSIVLGDDRQEDLNDPILNSSSDDKQSERENPPPNAVIENKLNISPLVDSANSSLSSDHRTASPVPDAGSDDQSSDSDGGNNQVDPLATRNISANDKQPESENSAPEDEAIVEDNINTSSIVESANSSVSSSHQCHQHGFIFANAEPNPNQLMLNGDYFDWKLCQHACNDADDCSYWTWDLNAASCASFKPKSGETIEFLRSGPEEHAVVSGGRFSICADVPEPISVDNDNDGETSPDDSSANGALTTMTNGRVVMIITVGVMVGFQLL